MTRGFVPILGALILALITLSHPAWAGLDSFEQMDPLPPVIEDTAKATDCTAVYLVADTELHDLLAVRMRFTPNANDRPHETPYGDVMPCPKDIPPRVSGRALDACAIRASDPKVCVYADMGREFLTSPNANNTAENLSRCVSETSTDIGVACFRSGKLEICGVGCGTSPETAVAAAVKRCETRHLQSCPITGSLPVLPPK